MIIGTAGHIDHGKTALVRALTGVDTDRLPEEKRRGITIELGFAPLRFDDGLQAGIVDVPGHEAFVRTMLAGASGIDVALLVIAADEGVMPQTREHLAILSILDVREAVIALTKRDLVDDEWLALVMEDVRGTLAGTLLAGATAVPVSATRGDGVAELRAALRAALERVAPRGGGALFRMPIDRAFTVKGTGTVVTGTVWSGSIGRDGTVRIFPGGREARVRGVQRHAVAADRAQAGERCAVALAGVDVHDVARGGVLVESAAWRASRTIIADVALLPDAPAALTPRTRVRLHLGTVDVSARVIVPGGQAQPGQSVPARVVLDEAIVARGGDRFVLRQPSPAVTIGGGVVVDPMPSHTRAKPWSAKGMDDVAIVSRLVADEGAAGVAIDVLPVRAGIPPERVATVIDLLRETVARCGDVLVANTALDAIHARLLALLTEYHRRAPLEPGAPLEEIRSQLGGNAAVDRVLAGAKARGDVVLHLGILRLADWTPTLSSHQQQTLELLRGVLRSTGREPPAVTELVAAHGDSVPALLRVLERDGEVVRVDQGRFYDAEVLNELTDAVRGGMVKGREYTPAELRDLLGVSRKFLIPLLEYCDRRRITARVGGGRVLSGG